MEYKRKCQSKAANILGSEETVQQHCLKGAYTFSSLLKRIRKTVSETKL